MALAAIIPTTANRAPGKRAQNVRNPTIVPRTQNAMETLAGSTSWRCLAVKNRWPQKPSPPLSRPSTPCSSAKATCAYAGEKTDQHGAREEIGEKTEAEDARQKQ